MAESIYSLIPDPDVLLSLEPEELAGILLEYLNSLPEQEQKRLNRYNFRLPHTVAEYPREYQDKLSEALMEAWVWLEREGLLAPKPGEQGEWVFITRRGKQLSKRTDLEVFQKKNLLPQRLLHPVIAQKVWSAFIRGEYDTAVFQAFKEVEIAVRSAGGFIQKDYGTDLMRKAFNVSNGPLTDVNVSEGEREALSNLFAGAIGLYKNPHSHRNVSLDAEEAVEMIMLASHLHKIVDSRNS